MCAADGGLLRQLYDGVRATPETVLLDADEGYTVHRK